MKHTLINADVFDGLNKLPDKSVHCGVSSVPYWALRDYDGIEGQIGLELTLQEYLIKMVEVFREVRRVLRDDGTFWLNIGDKYSTSNPVGRSDTARIYKKDGAAEKIQRLRRGSGGHDKADVIPNRYFRYDLPQKNLMLVPFRLAQALQQPHIRCNHCGAVNHRIKWGKMPDPSDELICPECRSVSKDYSIEVPGWIVRSDIIWNKPNSMPEGATDRPYNSHEHIFMLSKGPLYFYDAEAVRQKQTGNAHSRGKGTSPKSADPKSKIRANLSFQSAISQYVVIPGGRTLRSVWTIASQPRSDAHFAAFPDELARRCIRAGTSDYGCCPDCGAPWVRIVKAEGGTKGKGWHDHSADMQKGKVAPPSKSFKDYRRTTIGWKPGCSCKDNIPVPCTVLDMFGGRGTVGDICEEQNRNSILIDINPAYIDLQKKCLKFDELSEAEFGLIEVLTS